jgi:ABC-type lipoprotein export system ATPase subunit
MELYSKVAHEQNGAVIFVTHGHRVPSVFDTICEIEEGMIRLRLSFDEERR